jgi:putative addiction module component (TIGR02574 family)
MPDLDLDRMSPAERLALIGRIWDSLADDEIPMTPAQQVELDTRLARFEEEKPSYVGWEDVRAEPTNRGR